MKKEQVINTAYKMVTSFNLLATGGKGEAFLTVMEGMGYTADRVEPAIRFLQENLTQAELDSFLEQNAYIAYMQSIDELEKYMKMAQGYQDMGDINLSITEESHHLEEEGAKAHEMDTEKSEGNAIA
jgi:hypothetical protein